MINYNFDYNKYEFIPYCAATDLSPFLQGYLGDINEIICESLPNPYKIMVDSLIN